MYDMQGELFDSSPWYTKRGTGIKLLIGKMNNGRALGLSSSDWEMGGLGCGSACCRYKEAGALALVHASRGRDAYGFPYLTDLSTTRYRSAL